MKRKGASDEKYKQTLYLSPLNPTSSESSTWESNQIFITCLECGKMTDKRISSQISHKSCRKQRITHKMQQTVHINLIQMPFSSSFFLKLFDCISQQDEDMILNWLKLIVHWKKFNIFRKTKVISPIQKSEKKEKNCIMNLFCRAFACIV